jgi:hypothetical protein
MIRISYTAKRALSGHAVGDLVTLTFSAAEIAARRVLVRDVQKTLSGRRETLLHNGTRAWDITTGPMETTTLDGLEEFLTAVEDGSAFEFEVFYTVGSPASDPDSAETRLRTVPTLQCVLGSDQYSLARVINYSNGGEGDPYQVSFTVEEAP